ncbi:Tn7-like element transposition protein TnsE [Halomonas hibernica]|uniref:Tn7-like element transposition protein TnsE n=1 Tax=Halomonas hibernica TaxID=2591147 RepID=UPI0015545455|nr:Tn7-like element transposition protein TnsE [Halomonas hibernica]
MSRTLEAEEIEVDAEEEPTGAKEAKLIYPPIEGVAFDGQINTTVVHNGDRASSRGKKSEDEKFPASDEESKSLGIADSVIDGSIAPGDLQQLGDEKIDHEQCFNYFPQLSEIIKQIANESDTALLQMQVKPLPVVPRCSYHMMDSETRRCYLLVRFRLRNGSERYLLEIDTTDNWKHVDADHRF